MRTYLLAALLALAFNSHAQKNQAPVKGTVNDNNGTPLSGAAITVNGTNSVSITDENGSFSILAPEGEQVLVVSFLGYKPLQLPIEVPLKSPLAIVLEEGALALEEVEVVSTGYQQIPKERATGSFVQLDGELINRRVGPNILERLEDVTSGLIFNRAGGPDDRIGIRGRSTLFANPQPLVVIDNFPYDGPLENINPNDVESITILKDAAAASIWGARAGNGVVLITTKKGKKGQKPQVSLNANVTVGERPDLYYRPQMSTADFVDMEIQLFERGHYTNAENSANHARLSPVVETLILQRDGHITEGEAHARLGAFRQLDVREDLDKYFHQNFIGQQYALGIRGGGQTHSYAVSGGYDHNSAPVTGNWSDRLSLDLQNNWSLLNEKLNLSLGTYLVQSKTQQGTELPGNSNHFLYLEYLHLL